MRFYLGLDIGTSAIKAILLNQDQQQLASASIPLTVSRPKEGWSEQNPEAWWQAVDTAISEIAKHNPEEMASLSGIGLSGQMHGLVALDQNDQPLRDAILWNDTRASIEAQDLDQNHPEFRSIGGNVVMAGFTAPKAVWMAKHEAELFKQIKTILLPKDYIRFRLSGDKVSDMSDASGTLWLDIGGRCWSEHLLSLCGLRGDQMPRLVEGSEVSAMLSPELCRKWGIEGDVIIAGGAGDNAAVAVGLGLQESHQSFISLGTSGVVFKVTDGFKENTAAAVHSFCHALPGRWHQMGVILSATDSLTWLSEVTGQDFKDLLAQMKPEDEAAIWPIFHPYLSGERTPHNNPNASGGFFGLKRSHHTGDMTRAVLQGVSAAIADAYDALNQNISSDQKQMIIATGGGANNDYWLRLIASLIDQEINLPQNTDIGAALGAARLAMLADHHDINQVCTPPSIARQISPELGLKDHLDKARKLSQSLYKTISSLT